ncbi:hypothetical protein [Nocardioides sp.]|uniref:hypothetical protein n=1 Tax=Nocardioides sp. TaxID=35761 RepID=UPI002610BE2D|nr:hypothetical protein [Nocardioides sp.]
MQQRRALLQVQRREQEGVVSWAQLQAAGWSDGDVRRAVRHRDLTRVHPRVYVDHTGELTRAQRVWAALLWAAPAAVCHLPAAGRTGEDAPIDIVIDGTRSLSSRPGIVVHRWAGFDELVARDTIPLRLRWAPAVLLRLRQAGSETDAVAILADTVGRGKVSAAAVRQVVEGAPKLRRRALILAVLDDLACGTESVLEHGFLVRVERAHGLPTPQRQAVRRDGRERRDLEYGAYGLVVELDGRINHDSWQAGNRDAARDLADIAAGRSVLRLRWAQVMTTPCATAGLLGRALAARGWAGVPTRCGPACGLDAWRS